MRLITFALAMILVAGCTTESPKADYYHQYQGTDGATVFFCRERGAPAAVDGMFVIDGTDHSPVGSGALTSAKLPPGRHELKLVFPFWTSMPTKKVVVDLEPNSIRYFYYTTDMRFLVVGPMPTMTVTPTLVEISEDGWKHAMSQR